MLVTKKAPPIKAPAVLPDGSIDENFDLDSFKGKKIVLFFWPLDFTFVCPSEIIAHSNRIKDFHDKGVEVVGVSIDSVFTHFAWRNTPVKSGGIGEVKIHLVSDVKREISQAYGILHPSELVALRASFLIDENGIVRHQVVNDLPLGRSVDEMLRMVDALTFHQEHGEVCPANWKAGDDGMKADAKGVASYLEKHASEL